MNPFFFLMHELLGTMRAKSALLFLGMIVTMFLFLAIFSCFFLVGTPVYAPSHSQVSPGEITVYLSPKLSNQDVDALYRQLRDRPDVADVHFLFAAELVPGRPGGAFRVRAVDPAHAAGLAAAINKMAGVEQVIAAPRSTGTKLNLSMSVRIGLVLGLVVTGFSTLFIARAAFHELLRGFTPQIVLMELAGTAHRTMQAPIIALGIICGLVASVALIVVIYVLHVSALSPSGAVLSTAAGLTSPGRVLASSLLSLLLGLVLGALAGMLGASLLSRFQDYS